MIDFDAKTRSAINKTINEVIGTCEYLPVPETATLVAEEIDKKLQKIIKKNRKYWHAYTCPPKDSRIYRFMSTQLSNKRVIARQYGDYLFLAITSLPTSSAS